MTVFNNGAPDNDTYDTATGMTNANESDFLDESETGQAPEEGEPTHEESADNVETLISTDGDNVEEQEETPEEQPETPAPEQLFANKFKSVDELKAAFTELGGNADLYKDPNLLAEAYLVRQSEFTRARQEQSERERLAAQNNQPDVTQMTPEQIADEAIKQIDFSKITNIEQATREILRNVAELIDKKAKNNIDENTLIEKLAPQMRDQEAKTKALTSIEKDVPRLKTDTFFREQFARYVAANQLNPEVAKLAGDREAQLKTMMSGFLNYYSQVSEEAAKVRTQNTTAKQGQQIPNGGEALPTKSNPDEVDDILGAFESKQTKFG